VKIKQRYWRKAKRRKKSNSKQIKSNQQLFTKNLLVNCKFLVYDEK